ncbi:hypothetical protein J2X69_001561 [Algoriphagus sp. 4150]|uniref:hypothetical protein n=1 Tax=Algoriphagus sp. 4150 TaxID=2817756 RepID=UPI00285BCA51|nr:hypothetical protein [Algoriphagus sp. 4150]MDR7129226.1 hypothetical protein [Algoriphagus sp. 4150]
MKPYCQFSKRNIWMMLVWSFLTPLLTQGSLVRNASKPETNYSTAAAFGLTGPTQLCTFFGVATGEYSITSPSSAEYTWLLQDPDGSRTVLANGGSGTVGTIQIQFTKSGTYEVILQERSTPTATPSINSIRVEVSPGPAIVLKSDYLLCGENTPALWAMDPSDPDVGNYEFTWARDQEFSSVVKRGVGSAGNELIPTEEGLYFVRLTPTGSRPGCRTTSSTYVSSSADFQFIQSREEMCDGESVRIELDTRINGEWWYRTQGESAKISLGRNNEITLTSSQLGEPGIYEVGFIGNRENSPCPLEKITTIRLNEGPKINTSIVRQPTACSANDGSFRIVVEKDLVSLRVLELNLDLGPQAAGTEVPITNLDAGVYTIEAANTECRAHFFQAVQLSASVNETNIRTYKEECNLDGTNMGKVEITFPNGNVTGDYRILSRNSRNSIVGSLNDGDSITVDLPSGNYFFDFKHAGDECNTRIKTFTIDRKRDVPFPMPKAIEICGSYELDLQSDLNLSFTLTQPDGSDISARAGESITLTDGGQYSLLIDPSDNEDYCPTIKEFTVNKLDFEVEFNYEIVDENCLGDQIWRAEIQNLAAEDAIFRWYNSSGEIVGRSQEFSPTQFGEVYQLTVQSKAAPECGVTPIDIPYNQPAFSVEAILDFEEACRLFNIYLDVSENEDQVTWIEWNLYMEDGSTEELPGGPDLYEVSDDREGIYEAILYRDKQSGGRCEIERFNISIEASVLTPSPDLEESYPFCSKGNGIPAIDAGKHESYTWHFLTEDVVVGTDQTFTPSQAGDYELTVLSVEGCIYIEKFRVYDVCDVDYVFPNAMILGDPARDFRVTVSEGVSEAELYVFNSTGELIHHDVETEISFLSPILIWDGVETGRSVPQGTYAIVLILKNEFDLNEKVTGSLLVLE